ncbi:MAG: hypothetical protein INQ03_15740 [Candidatus Heimdallarchaeota archaeon]|nr:hypothetical protein [Candidatus Heimdallarchaeota archaeon]
MDQIMIKSIYISSNINNLINEFEDSDQEFYKESLFLGSNVPIAFDDHLFNILYFNFSSVSKDMAFNAKTEKINCKFLSVNEFVLEGINQKIREYNDNLPKGRIRRGDIKPTMREKSTETITFNDIDFSSLEYIFIQITELRDYFLASIILRNLLEEDIKPVVMISSYPKRILQYTIVEKNAIILLFERLLDLVAYQVFRVTLTAIHDKFWLHNLHSFIIRMMKDDIKVLIQDLKQIEIELVIPKGFDLNRLDYEGKRSKSMVVEDDSDFKYVKKMFYSLIATSLEESINDVYSAISNFPKAIVIELLSTKFIPDTVQIMMDNVKANSLIVELFQKSGLNLIERHIIYSDLQPFFYLVLCPYEFDFESMQEFEGILLTNELYVLQTSYTRLSNSTFHSWRQVLKEFNQQTYNEDIENTIAYRNELSAWKQRQEDKLLEIEKEKSESKTAMVEKDRKLDSSVENLDDEENFELFELNSKYIDEYSETQEDDNAETKIEEPKELGDDDFELFFIKTKFVNDSDSVLDETDLGKHKIEQEKESVIVKEQDYQAHNNIMEELDPEPEKIKLQSEINKYLVRKIEQIILKPLNQITADEFWLVQHVWLNFHEYIVVVYRHLIEKYIHILLNSSQIMNLKDKSILFGSMWRVLFRYYLDDKFKIRDDDSLYNGLSIMLGSSIHFDELFWRILSIALDFGLSNQKFAYLIFDSLIPFTQIDEPTQMKIFHWLDNFVDLFSMEQKDQDLLLKSFEKFLEIEYLDEYFEGIPFLYEIDLRIRKIKQFLLQHLLGKIILTLEERPNLKDIEKVLDSLIQCGNTSDFDFLAYEIFQRKEIQNALEGKINRLVLINNFYKIEKDEKTETEVTDNEILLRMILLRKAGIKLPASLNLSKTTRDYLQYLEELTFKGYSEDLEFDDAVFVYDHHELSKLAKLDYLSTVGEHNLFFNLIEENYDYWDNILLNLSLISFRANLIDNKEYQKIVQLYNSEFPQIIPLFIGSLLVDKENAKQLKSTTMGSPTQWEIIKLLIDTSKIHYNNAISIGFSSILNPVAFEVIEFNTLLSEKHWVRALEFGKKVIDNVRELPFEYYRDNYYEVIYRLFMSYSTKIANVHNTIKIDFLKRLFEYAIEDNKNIRWIKKLFWLYLEHEQDKLRILHKKMKDVMPDDEYTILLALYFEITRNINKIETLSENASKQLETLDSIAQYNDDKMFTFAKYLRVWLLLILEKYKEAYDELIEFPMFIQRNISYQGMKFYVLLALQDNKALYNMYIFFRGLSMKNRKFFTGTEPLVINLIINIRESTYTTKDKSIAFWLLELLIRIARATLGSEKNPELWYYVYHLVRLNPINVEDIKYSNSLNYCNENRILSHSWTIRNETLIRLLVSINNHRIPIVGKGRLFDQKLIRPMMVHLLLSLDSPIHAEFLILNLENWEKTSYRWFYYYAMIWIHLKTARITTTLNLIKEFENIPGKDFPKPKEFKKITNNVSKNFVIANQEVEKILMYFKENIKSKSITSDNENFMIDKLKLYTLNQFPYVVKKNIELPKYPSIFVELLLNYQAFS